MTTAEAAATERMAALVASTRAAQAESAQADAVANDPANWPLSPRMRRFAGMFARGFSYTGQPSRLAATEGEINA